MAEKAPAEGEVVEGEQPPGEGGEESEKKLECCKELSEEQLKAFYEKAADSEEAVQYMAMEVLKLPRFTYDGNIAMIVDYFVGILMCAQEEHLSAPHTLLMYQLGMELMEHIKSGMSMKWTEKKFKNLIFRWSVKVKNTNHVPLLTTIELQKIVPFYMNTVFQHYRLYSSCFNRESLHWRYYEEVWVETFTPWNWEPLKDFDTLEEIDEDKETQANYELALAEWEAERAAAEAKAKWLLEHPLFPPAKPRPPPADLDEYIDFSVSNKVEELMKFLEDQYQQRRTVLCDRVQILNEITPKKKLIVKEMPFKLPPLKWPDDHPL